MKTSAVLLSFLLLTGLASAKTWEIDPVHTNVMFKVRHLISSVTGQFNDFTGTISFDEKKPEATAMVDVTIQAKSIDTNNQKRDDHLRSADFFDVATKPTLTFKSTKLVKGKKDTGKLHGKLTIRGVEKDVVLDVQFVGTSPDPFDPKVSRAAFWGSTKINRKDFGVSWNKTLDKGGMLLSEDVEITLQVEAVEKLEPAAPAKM